MAKGYPTITEETQIIDGDLELDEFAYRPSHIRRWFVNNILRRMFAYLVGYDGTKFKMLRVTPGGILKVGVAGAGYSAYESNPSQVNHEDWVTVAGVATSVETFSDVMASVLIRVKDFDMVCEISTDGITYGQKFMLLGSVNEAFSLDMSCKLVRFSNADTGGTADGSYQVMGFR